MDDFRGENISDFSFFDELLTEDERNKIKIVVFSEHEIIGCLGKEEMSHLYFILEGSIKLENLSTKRSLYSLFNLNKGSLVGVSTLFEKINSKWNIKVASKVFKGIKIPVEVIKRLKKENLEFNKYLVDHFGCFIAKYWELSQIKAIYGNKGLISYKLMKNSTKNYVFLRNIGSFIENLNISNVRFYSVLNQLIDEGLIAKSGNSILILKPKEMMSLYSDDI